MGCQSGSPRRASPQRGRLLRTTGGPKSDKPRPLSSPSGGVSTKPRGAVWPQAMADNTENRGYEGCADQSVKACRFRVCSRRRTKERTCEIGRSLHGWTGSRFRLRQIEMKNHALYTCTGMGNAAANDRRQVEPVLCAGQFGLSAVDLRFLAVVKSEEASRARACGSAFSSRCRRSPHPTASFDDRRGVVPRQASQ